MARMKNINGPPGQNLASAVVNTRANIPNNSVSTSFDCGIHQITYRSPTGVGCPACLAERERDQMRQSLQQTTNQLRMMHDENRAMQVQVDLTAAMREATALLDDDDLLFLKGVLYEWRDHRSIGLKTTHGPRLKKRTLPQANGFIAIPRQGDPYGHVCSSMGGLAIAGYFDEATNSLSGGKAMEFLARAMHEHLPGGGQ